ncbi:CMRF35-like molecule 9 isoform X1 [Dromiciops gliroides]|uniref:CMRF35-like molecule 9 isoform X1 n=1 Tax=Dromiciops gliroides TaxID=33562 RepID=UPI001CC3DCFE|nr:CMRF35-like molecule 9 isoform X1 [Dromiciops gliroides]
MRLLLLWGWIIIPGYEAMVGPEEVRGPEGSSLSVQCSYEDKHKERRKYWCKDKQIVFGLCSTVISTEAGREMTEGNLSIKDNPQDRTFTVIMRNITLNDAGKYQCGISLLGPDEVFKVTVVVFPGLRSSVSPNPSLQPLSTRSVQQKAKVWKTQSPELSYEAMVGPEEVRGPEGSSLSVQCSYEDKHKERRKYWCKDKQIVFGLCSTVISTEAGREMTEGNLSIKDNPQDRTFTVIMRNITLNDAGKYQCGISLLGPDEVFKVTVVVFPGLRSSVSPNPSLQPLSTRSVQQKAKVWKTQSPELTSSSYHPRVNTPTQEKIKPTTFTNLVTRATIFQRGQKTRGSKSQEEPRDKRGQENFQTRTQQDVAQPVTSHHSLREINPRSRPSIPLIRILAPCIILLLLLVVATATLLILLSRRKKAQLKMGENGQFHYSNSVKESQD